MTARRTGDEAAVKAAATRATKGSVQEAIGKLIGDDAARDRGTTERQAGVEGAGVEKAEVRKAEMNGSGADHAPTTGKSPRR